MKVYRKQTTFYKKEMELTKAHLFCGKLGQTVSRAAQKLYFVAFRVEGFSCRCDILTISLKCSQGI